MPPRKSRNVTTAYMEQILRMLESHRIPNDLSDEFVWGALIAIYERVDSINGQVTKNTETLSNARKVLAVLGSIGMLIIGAFLKEIIAALF